MIDLVKAKGWIVAALIVLWVTLMIILTGCGSVSVEKFADGSYKAESRSLFKDIKDVSIEKAPDGSVNASMGESITNDNAESAWMLVCTINPALPLCQADK